MIYYVSLKKNVTNQKLKFDHAKPCQNKQNQANQNALAIRND